MKKCRAAAMAASLLLGCALLASCSSHGGSSTSAAATTSSHTTTSSNTTSSAVCAEHVWDTGVHIDAASCGEYGCTVYTCTLCGIDCRSADTEPRSHIYTPHHHAGDCEHGGYTEYVCTGLGCTEAYIVPDDDGFTPSEHEYTQLSHTEADCCHFETTVLACTKCPHTYTVTGTVYGDHIWSHQYTTDVYATTEHPGEKSIHCTVDGCTQRKNITVIPKIEPTLPFIPVS